MVNRKLLFSVFNSVLKSYSSKLVYVNCKRSYTQICSNKYQYLPHTRIVNCSTSAPNQVVSFEDVKKATNNKNVFIIDVREPEELKQTGQIPNSINIPLGDVERVFQSTTNEDFIKQYGIPKPDQNTLIICSCLLGKRSASAQGILQQLGYQNVRNYLVNQVQEALQNMLEMEFIEKFGRSKPNQDSHIIFYCLLGKRSARAQETVQKLGYKRVFNYIGGWQDWEMNMKLTN